LLRLHAGGGNHLRPLGDLGIEKLLRLRRVVADGDDADVVEAGLDLRLVDRLGGLGC
jgi:hypothetical protein